MGRHLINRFAVILSLAVCQPGVAEDHLSIIRAGETHSVDGRVMVEAADGGLLLLSRDGVIWAVQPEEIVDHESDDQSFEPLDQNGMTACLLEELPSGFRIYTTNHYVIAYNTSKTYAQWCGSLYERLYRAFYNFWRRRGVKLRDPEVPLVALIFENQNSYMSYSRDELGEVGSAIAGYYSLRSNRMTTYDLTGLESLRQEGARPHTSVLINQMLSQPDAEPTVATLIHEATHQLAYNSGLQTRYADNPLWLSEGLAIYFETPDLRSKKGWRGIGTINYRRLAQLRGYLVSRSQDSLVDLITQDDRLRRAETASDAYAESWALCYYLLTKRQKAFVRYLDEMSQKTPLLDDSGEERLALFQKHFGDDLQKFDRQFLEFVAGLR